LITLDEKPEFAWKPQISRTVVAGWLDLQHGKHRRLSGRISDAASLGSLIWNLRQLHRMVILEFDQIFEACSTRYKACSTRFASL
jgi:hypothetical protein